MTATPCPTCGHTCHLTAAVGRFHPTGPLGYRDAADNGAPLRVTRAEAEADVCRRQQEARR